MFLTERAEGTGTTVSNAGGREHTHGPIMFAASLLRIKRGSLSTTQGAVRLRKKISPCQASCSRCTCPVRGTEGWPSRGEVRGWQGFSLRGGKLGETHRGWLPLSAEFLAQIPHPLRKDLPGFLTAWCVGTPPVAVLHPLPQPAAEEQTPMGLAAPSPPVHPILWGDWSRTQPRRAWIRW